MDTIAPKKHINDKLGESVCIDSVVVRSIGLEQLAAAKRGQGNLTDLTCMNHPARGLLHQYHHQGVPVVLQTLPWMAAQLQTAVHRGPQKLAHDHISFLQADMADMAQENGWCSQ